MAASTAPKATVASGSAATRGSVRRPANARGSAEAACEDTIRRPVGIEIAFRVLRLGQQPVFPKLKLWNADTEIFNALDTDPRWHDSVPPGDYVSTAWIPENLLNEGLVGVAVAVVSLRADRLHPHATFHDAVSFHVHDPGEGDSSRGIFTGTLRGAVRPQLEWVTEER